MSVPPPNVKPTIRRFFTTSNLLKLSPVESPTMALQMPTSPKDLKLFEAAIEANETACPVPDLINNRQLNTVIAHCNGTIPWDALPMHDTTTHRGRPWVDLLVNLLAQINQHTADGIINEGLIGALTNQIAFRPSRIEQWAPLTYYSIPGRYDFMWGMNCIDLPIKAAFIRDALLSMARWASLAPKDYAPFAYACAAFSEMATLPTERSRFLPRPESILTGTY